MRKEFADDEVKKEDDYDREADSKLAALFFGVAAGVVFSGALVVALLFYFVFLRWLKLKGRVSGVIALLVAFLSGLYIYSVNSFSLFIGALRAFPDVNFIDILQLFIPGSVLLGSLVGWGFILKELYEIKTNPHRVELEGFWTYKLKLKRTPFEYFRRKSNIKKLHLRELVTENRTPLGINEDDDQVVYRFTEEAVKHTLVTGAAGSGKTISLLSMMRADIESGRTVIAIDFKRSPEFASKLALWANEFGVPFYHFEKGDPSSYKIKHSLGQSSYDPFSSGSGSEMVLNLREYDTASAVYKAQMQQLLQIVFALMEQADKSKAPSVDWEHGGIYQLASSLTDIGLKELLVACEDKPIFNEAEVYIPKATLGKGMEFHALEELRGQMRTIVASAYGGWFRIGDNSRNIDLLKIMTSGKPSVVLFSFNSEDEPEFSKYVGSMIFADLRAVSSRIRNLKAKRITSVYVDEFQAVPPTAVTGLLEKARESKIAMTLAQQAFEQIITSAPENGEAYLQSILVTCSNFLTHAGMTQDSAERLSKLLGKEWKPIYSRTNKSDGGWLKGNFINRRKQIVSSTNHEVWKVEPSEFMGLSAPTPSNNKKVTAILVNKSAADPKVKKEGTIARKVLMIPGEKVLREEYNVEDSRDSTVSRNEETPLSSVSGGTHSNSGDISSETPVFKSEDDFWNEIELDSSSVEKHTNIENELDLDFSDYEVDYELEDDGDFSLEEIGDDTVDLDNDLDAFDLYEKVKTPITDASEYKHNRAERDRFNSPSNGKSFDDDFEETPLPDLD